MLSVLRAFRARLRDSVDAARSIPSLPVAGRATTLYAFVPLYCLLWALLGPERRPYLFFSEGGPIDGLSTTFFSAAALGAWIMFWQVRRSEEPGWWFWLASAAGLAFFAIDDRFQLHERFDDDWMEPAFGAAPLGFRNWNDMLVLGYGVVGLVLLAAAVPVILRYRQTAVLLAAAFLCYGMHTAIDSLFKRAPAKEITEEIFKVLTGATLVLAYMQGALAAGTRGTNRRPVLWPHVVVLVGVVVAVVTVMYSGDLDWRRALVRKWGPPDSWIASIYLGSAALLCWFAWLPTRPRGRFGSPLLCGAAAGLAWLAFDEATISGWTVLHSGVTPPLVSEVLDGRLALLHRAAIFTAGAAAVAGVILFVLWRRQVVRSHATLVSLAAAIGVLVAASACAPFPEETLRGVLGSLLRLASCAGLAVAAVLAFSARATSEESGFESAGSTLRSVGLGAAWIASVSVLLVAVRLKQVGMISFAPGDGFDGTLDDSDYFGRSIGAPGDLDGDGVIELAIGTPGDDDAGANRGAVWMLSLDADGRVETHHKIAQGQGGFEPSPPARDTIGRAVVSPGDLDGDGDADLVVAANTDRDGGQARGAVWIMFLERDGTVRSSRKISGTTGGFAGDLDDGDQFGSSLAPLGDVDGDGVPDLAVGARSDDDGGPGRGAAWILFLDRDGSVRAHRKISDTAGAFDGVMDNGDRFGESMAAIGDLDGDGVPDLAVGAEDDDDGGTDRGAVWILFLQSDGAVRSHVKISSTAGGFRGRLADGDDFGHSVAAVGDVDGDGVIDLAVGADEDGDGGASRGAVWVLFLNADGTVKDHRKISATRGGFTGTLHEGDEFGESVLSPGDLDGDGVPDLLVGAKDRGARGRERGAVWVLFLRADGTVASHRKIADNPAR